MNTLKRITSVVGAAALLALMSGCAAGSVAERSLENSSQVEESNLTIEDSNFSATWVDVPDGGQVLCIWHGGGYMSCDWEGYHAEQAKR